MDTRLEVNKTYKLYVGGRFSRSESGRSYAVSGPTGGFLANAARASRKDLRDAVVAAGKVAGSWAGLSAYNRGQVLYRVAEMMEARRDELIDEVSAAEGGEGASQQVEEAVDCWVYYAGWTDKISQVTGALNPVAGPYFNLTAPEPIGIIGIVAPETGSLLGLVERLAPALCGGNAVVLACSQAHPHPAIALAECLHTSDVPAGVVNLLTGFKDELVPVLASHGDVDALDVSGVAPDTAADVEAAAASNVKRIVRPGPRLGPYEVTAFMEMKTVWHPKGA
ncbi:MAG: aldehyde dehydrogenase family protein [Gemmatimonadetes bacterium]|nr:aldehyde dehydrogenase family protein [Gemmatimonadota bacterium]